jgi:hypothetical protein
MKKIFNSFKPYLIWLFPVAIILVVLYFFFDKILIAIKSLFSNGVDYKTLGTFGATISDFDSKRIAEGLYVAMYEFGTDEAQIFSLLKGVAKPDFAKIYNSFGQRYYMEYTGTWSDASLGVNLDLWGWLKSELSAGDLELLKESAPNIF